MGTVLGVVGTVRNKAQDYWVLRRVKKSRLEEVLSDIRVQQEIDAARARQAEPQGWPSADEVREAVERAQRGSK